MNHFDLSGRVAVVSGGAGWLGTQMVAALAAAGAHVTAVSRNSTKAKEALSGFEGDISVLSADVTSDEWPDAIRSVAARSGGLDILINNAHVGRGGSLRTSTADMFREGYELAVIAAATGINAARESLTASARAGRYPSVINVASMYGSVAPDPSMYETESSRNPPYYGAAKAGLLQLTRYSAAELGHLGVRVNAIAPGPFPSVAAQANSDFTRELGTRTMLGRVGHPAEIQTATLFLASPSSSFVTGIVLPVDGGWTAW